MATASKALLRSASPGHYDKIRDYQYRVHQHSYQWYSRSVNPRYREIHKLDDVTRYDSRVCNVTHYQDYPNRAGTPKRSPGRRRSAKRVSQSTTSHPDPILKMVSNLSFSSSEIRDKLASRVREGPIRLKTAGPLIAKVTAGRDGAVMNDFHVRETNPGFARNKMGGFYTR